MMLKFPPLPVFTPCFAKDRENPKEKENCRKYRRLVMRYINLAVVETLRSMCIKAAERFPNYEKLVDCRKYIYLMEVKGLVSR